MMTCNGSYAHEVGFGGSIWCITESDGEKCKYRFYPSNIPTKLGGSDVETVCGEIICDSVEDARECASAIVELIKNGYREDFCWTYALDMDDVITNIFLGEPMRHIHLSGASDPDDDALKKIESAVKDTSLVFCSFLVPSAGSGRLSRGERALEGILLERDAEIWWQRSITPSTDGLDIWYR